MITEYLIHVFSMPLIQTILEVSEMLEMLLFSRQNNVILLEIVIIELN